MRRLTPRESHTFHPATSRYLIAAMLHLTFRIREKQLALKLEGK